MYKKALNAFFLKVHPDFFQHNHAQQAANENAVAQLNELLSWAREFKAGTLRPPPATRIAFVFHRRLQDDEHPSSSNSGKSSTSSSSSSSSATVQSTFELPDNFTASEANRGLVERSVNKFLRDLLRRAECIDSVADSVSAAEDATAARLEAKPLRRRPPRQRRRQGGAQAAEGEEDDAAAAGPRSLLDEATEALHERWTLTAAPTLEELIEADQIIFARALSPLQCAAAVHTLRAALGEMHYETWESMPLILSDHFAVGEDMTGSLTIPWDFTPPQFVSFLRHNARAVAACRDAAVAFAGRLEGLIADICRTADLDDVLVSCSHRAAEPALRLLHRHAALLHREGVTGLTLEVADRYATRANGVLVLSHTMHTTEQLREWLAAVGPKVPLQQRLYAASKQMLESTMWHLKEFREMARPGGVDAFNSNDCTYAQRLAWAKELFRIGPALAQWDWSDFAFTLSPQLEVDWAARHLSLPYNFDGDSLLRYIDDVQRAAKEAARRELLDASALARVQAEDERRRQHDRELQLAAAGGEEATEAADGTGPLTGVAGGESVRYEGDDSDSAAAAAAMERMLAEEQQQTPGEAAATGETVGRSFAEVEEALRRQQLRDLYRQTGQAAAPHTEEYLASSSDAVDTLQVERPLSHAVHFNSDAEADEQLRWEGFYQAPYVDQVPTGDLDDMAHAYMLTNRWHREAAAKKLLEEMQSTYGKKSRKFDYQKMGDVLEINNAKVQPKGFPVLARGTRPPDL